MKDYRLTIKVRNNRILKAIEDIGATLGKKWCDANGLGYGTVNRLINLTISPLLPNGDLSFQALKLCELLNKIPMDLWSNEQLYPLERNFSEMEMSHEQIVALLPPEQQQYLPDFSNLENAQTKKLIVNAMSTLTQREKGIIRMRFESDLTLEECSKRLYISGERVSQIEKKALGKLRRPSTNKSLRPALDVYD